MLPIVLALAAAGALAGGGAGAAFGGILWFKRTADAAAAEQAKADSENIKDVLRQKMSEQEVRDQAKAMGVDVEAAVEGYRAAQRGQVDIEKLVKDLIAGKAGVPMADAAAASTGRKAALPLQRERVESNAEIRRWARENGFDVADKGQIPRRVLDAFREAH